MSSINLKDVDFGEHGIIYITPDTDRSFASEWTSPATRDLLRILPRQFELFNNGKIPSKRRLFESVGKQMSKKGYSYTAAQCENKWKSLKRRYLAKYEKMLTGSSSNGYLKPKRMFDKEIEDVLKLERPSFKKELDELSKTNLNDPPGFHINIKEDDDDMPDDEFDTEDHDYSQSDEKLVEMVLKDSNSINYDRKPTFANNIEYLLTSQDNEEDIQEETKYNIPSVNSQSKDDNSLTQEVKELKKVIKKSLDTQTQLLRNQSATNEQLLISLDNLDKRGDEIILLKKRKLEKQSELVQQVKIQNSLLAKLIQKLGSNSNNK